MPRGRQHKPESKLKPGGEAAKKRKGNRSKSPKKASDGLPKAPRWLGKDAKKLWRVVVPELHRMDVLSETDLHLVARYVETFSTWRRAQEVINREGFTYEKTDRNGSKMLRPRPEVNIAKEANSQLLKMEGHLGFTPHARLALDAARVPVNPPTQDPESDDGEDDDAPRDKSRFFAPEKVCG